MLNPWPIIGGVATSIVAEGEFVKSDGAKIGDVLVLTKPLGTQIAVNVHQWRRDEHKFWNKCMEQELLTESEAEDMMHSAVTSMARLNRSAGKLMTKYSSHACTDGKAFSSVPPSILLLSRRCFSCIICLEQLRGLESWDMHRISAIIKWKR